MFVPLQSNPYSIPNLHHPWPGFHLYMFCRFQMSHKLHSMELLRLTFFTQTTSLRFIHVCMYPFLFPNDISSYGCTTVCVSSQCWKTCAFFIVFGDYEQSCYTHLYPLICMLTSNVWEFQLLHILVSTWYCQFLIWPILIGVCFYF